MSDMRTELDRALRRVIDDMCPNCVTPWKCNGPHESPADRIAELTAANEAAMTAHKAAQSYADATAAAWVATQSALAAALIEHQGDKP